MKIIKIGMNDCKPCKDVDGYLLELSKEYEFELETYNISAETERKQRIAGKRLLSKYGTIKVPLIVIADESRGEFAAIYREQISEDIEEYKHKLEEILKQNG